MSFANNRNRIFENLRNTYSDNQRIIDFVKDKIVKEISIGDTGTLEDNSSIPAGYTYFGQMIVHDIVTSTNLNPSRQVTPKLDLDSIYDEKEFCNNEIFDEDGRFILGKARDKDTGEFISDSDLLRLCNGQARIPDLRNDENVIISQLHLLWLKFHNKVIEELLVISHSRAERIKSARNVVVFVFNKITINDYLENILHEEIFFLYKNGFQIFYDINQDITQIPTEFSHATFRFGHSMVRESYDINNTSTVSKNLSELFLRNPIYITNDMIVQWGHFFEYESRIPTLPSSASRIDTRITYAMNQAPFGSVNKSITDINLYANLDSSLAIPTGKQIYEKLNSIPLFKKLLVADSAIYKDINNLKISLPFWPYILREAEKQNVDTTLGIIGSIINAEVISISSKSALRGINQSAMIAFTKKIGLMQSSNDLSMKDLLEFLQQ